MTFTINPQSKTITIEGAGFISEITAFMADHSFDATEWRIESKYVQVEIKRWDSPLMPPFYPTCNSGDKVWTVPENP
jgi:hypothetical protein